MPCPLTEYANGTGFTQRKICPPWTKPDKSRGSCQAAYKLTPKVIKGTVVGAATTVIILFIVAALGVRQRKKAIKRIGLHKALLQDTQNELMESQKEIIVYKEASPY